RSTRRIRLAGAANPTPHRNRARNPLPNPNPNPNLNPHRNVCPSFVAECCGFTLMEETTIMSPRLWRLATRPAFRVPAFLTLAALAGLALWAWRNDWQPSLSSPVEGPSAAAQPAPAEPSVKIVTAPGVADYDPARYSRLSA